MSLSRIIFGKNEDKTDEENRFLYIVEAQNDDEDGDSAAYEIDSDQWRGRIHKIQQHIENSIKNLEKKQDQKLSEKIDGLEGKMKSQIESLDGKMNTLKDDINKKFDYLIENLIKKNQKEE